MIFAHKQEVLNGPNYFVCINTKFLSGNKKTRDYFNIFFAFSPPFSLFKWKNVKRLKNDFYQQRVYVKHLFAG